MAVMISTNTFVNASFFDESRNFCAYYNCRRFVRVNPKKSRKTKVIFCLNLNTKEVGLQNSGNGGFGFKPSFDQYLQVMESVKTARKKKKSDSDGGGNGDSELRNRVSDSDKRIDRVFKRNEENGIQRVTKDVRLSKSGESSMTVSEDERFRRTYSREEIRSDRRIDKGFKRSEESGIKRVTKDVRLSKSGESSMTVSDDERFKRTSYSREEMVIDRRIDRGFKRNEESGIKRVAKDVRLNKSGESLSEDERFKRTYLREEIFIDKRIDRGFKRSEESGIQRVAKDVRLNKSGESLSDDERFKRTYSTEEIVIDKRIDRGFKRSEESGIQRVAKDVRLNKSGESLSDDERFKRTYSREEIVIDKRIDRGFKRSEESGIQRVIKDVRLSKSVESSVNISEDERLKRTSYSRQEMVSDNRIDNGFKRSEESGIQRVIKDARLSKSVESLVTVSEDERFKRTSNSKQETGRYQRSSDTSRGIERGYKGDGFVVEGRRNERISRDEKWSKRGETSVTVSEDESFGRRYPKQEMGRYQRSSDTSKGFERGSKGDGLDLVAEEKRIQRIANEMGAFRSGKLTVTKRIGSKRDDHDDDDSLFDMETPAFRFSDESSDIVDRPATSRVEMEDRIEKLAKVLNGADINMPEWVFSKAIRSARIRYNDYTIMRLIQFLGKLGNWRRVIQVIEWLQKQDRYKSNKLRIIYTNALNVLGKSRRPVEALNVFHAMLLQISSYPDMVAYRSVAVTLGQAGHIKELFHVIDTMRSPPKKKFKPTTLVKWDPRLEPDVVVYNAVLNACVQRKQWEGAFWVLQQFKQRGQKPSPITYGLVMEVMLACEKYNLVHEFFRKMQKSSIPNALAYRVLVNTLWKEGKTDEAIQTVDDMESRGIVGSAALYYDLGRCLCSAGRCNEGLDMIKKICRVANKPLVVTYTGLIQACIDSGNIKDAAYIFNHMKEICSPNLITCNIMLKAYLESGLFEEARELFQKMSEDGDHIKSSSDHETRVLPDTHTFNTMLGVWAKQKKWDDFGYAYREMLRHGYHFNAKRHLKMVLEASRAGKEEVMEATWEHLRRSNRIPPSPLIKERFCRKLEKGDHVLAISSLADLDGKIEETELRAFSTSSWSKVLHRFEKDSVLRLMDDVNRRVGSRNESSDSVLGNLLSSCKEFMKNRTQVLL